MASMLKTGMDDGILKLLKKLNKTSVKDALNRGSLPFYVDTVQLGLIRSDFWSHLKKYPHAFELVDDTRYGYVRRKGVHLSQDYKSYKERTSAINRVLEDLKAKNALPFLQGWRNENYGVSSSFDKECVLEVERAASGIFGFLQYGVHVNGYTRAQNGEMKVWVGRRSKTKQTFPDMFDNMCAGGLPVGMGVLECTKKECQEEASVPDELLEKLKAVGVISYFYEDERGLQPETQFIYDLELPSDFVPVNADGEMGSFQLVTIEELKQQILDDNFMPTCAAICMDFLIRHGYMSFDTYPNIIRYIEEMHVPLQTIYR